MIHERVPIRDPYDPKAIANWRLAVHPPGSHIALRDIDGVVRGHCVGVIEHGQKGYRIVGSTVPGDRWIASVEACTSKVCRRAGVEPNAEHRKRLAGWKL